MPNLPPTPLATLLGPGGPAICNALASAQDFLKKTDPPALLQQVGQVIDAVPAAAYPDKRFFQKSYQGDMTKPPDDLLTGQGLFYITEQRRLCLDCTAGHYQMPWGYNHAGFNAMIADAIERGIVWDDHANIPGSAVKRLAARLVQVANGCERDAFDLSDDQLKLNAVNLGTCTGSVAVSSALKIALKRHDAKRPGAAPVVISLTGNYHGTDFFAQRLRGMWPDYVARLEVASIEPNDMADLRQAFESNKGRVAAFFAEPMLMNREAILLDKAFLQQARALCDDADACMVLDEIQTGFWYPEILMFRQFDLVPDIVIVGKGMTAGFSSLSAIIYRRELDCLAQYDSISTNGNAPLASLAALYNLDLLERGRAPLAQMHDYYEQLLQELPSAYPDTVAAIHGKGLMSGIKFRDVEPAIEFHRRCVERGLWVRVHAYHEGHSTVLTKLGLLADQQVCDFVVDQFHQMLKEMRNG